jgi:hypothetical protein
MYGTSVLKILRKREKIAGKNPPKRLIAETSMQYVQYVRIDNITMQYVKKA